MKQRTYLTRGLMAFFINAIFCATLCGQSTAFKVLVFSKTKLYRHASITNGIAAIRQLGVENKFAVDATEDSAMFTPESLAKYKVIIFLSTSGDILDDKQQDAFKHFIESGGGFVGIHAALAGTVATEGSWPWYGELLCASFTNHSAIVPATVVVEDSHDPSTAPLPAHWQHTDEWYNFISSPRGKAHILATVDERTYKGGILGADHPIAWCRKMGRGRIWYTALGHTEVCYRDPLFTAHLLGGIRLAAGIAKSNFAPSR